MGIEFSYAAETAFVSPTLLSIGVQHQHMTLVWALSPLVGFFLTPIMGSLSDRCRLDLGRRRPFIILFSIGIFIGKDKRIRRNCFASHHLCMHAHFSHIHINPFVRSFVQFQPDIYYTYISFNQNFIYFTQDYC